MRSSRNQRRRSPRDIQHKRRRGGQRFTGLLPSHFEIPSSSKTTRVRRAFSFLRVCVFFFLLYYYYRCRLKKPITSPVFSRDLPGKLIPQRTGLPSRLIPPYSPFLDECRARFFVWELIQCSQPAAAGAGGETRRRRSRAD